MRTIRELIDKEKKVYNYKTHTYDSDKNGKLNQQLHTQKGRIKNIKNANQNKKTMIRVNKLSDLLDSITDQALTRFTERPNEISNKELFDGLKIVQDLIERGQKQVSGAGETPLIQFNQQNNEVNVGSNIGNLSRDSRERVKSAITSLLSSITTATSEALPTIDEPIEVTEATIIDEEEETNG